MPLEQRIHALTHDELEALRRLQEGSLAPGLDDPAWGYLLELGLVWLDSATEPVTHRLTSVGRGYATEYKAQVPSSAAGRSRRRGRAFTRRTRLRVGATTTPDARSLRRLERQRLGAWTPPPLGALSVEVVLTVPVGLERRGWSSALFAEPAA
jgi:hypothetical protein